ncbi:hypothetical protein CAPTEDRAFT_175848 [Capitella teleta]|uniref:Mediator of RNA polymerase II transcription subunit 11 n=1 Tax=Capitella teleta TaxID=283909 RepID=R7TUL8_CAPTE|nr:hypothetical protein CAPTEDRAFT_175848 [Capitella teleta]|eukprot:ELT97613.1 hypothetical protein CAPTEDRAFT_175848 [Capitella teleta]
MSAPVDKIQQLETIEIDIAAAIQSSAHALTELSKDKPSIKQVELHSSNFLKKLESVENNLVEQLKYLAQVSTGHPHEGSSYSGLKDAHMAYHRLEHVKSRLAELDKMKSEHIMLHTRSTPAHEPVHTVQRETSQHDMDTH